MTLPSGTLLGQRYEIRDFVGSDGTLEVYKGLDLRLGRDIAVTMLDIRGLQDPGKLLTFEREAQIRAALHHPRLMNIHDFGHDASCAYQIAEWLEGQSLRKRLKSGPLAREEALSIGSEVLEGLDVIHSRNITLITLDETSVFLHRAVGAKLFAYALKRVDGPEGPGLPAARQESLKALARLLLDGLTRDNPEPEAHAHTLATLREIAEGEGPDLRRRLETLLREAPSARKRRGRRFWIAAGLLATCSGFAYLFAHRGFPRASSPPDLPQPPIQETQPTQDADAKRLYLYGMQLLDSRDADGLRRALTYLQGAATRDPAFAQAHASLGDCHGWMGLAGLLPRDEALRLGRASVQRALELDPGLGEAHAAAAFFDHWYERKPKEAGQEYRRAIELAPRSATVCHGYGVYLATTGSMDEGLKHLKQATELDPLSGTYRTSYARSLHESGRSREALDELAKAMDQGPTRQETLLVQREVLEQIGRIEEALQAAQRLGELGALSQSNVEALRTAFGTRGAKGYWNERVRQLEQSPDTDPVRLAEVVAFQGDKERVLRLLNRALREGSLQAVRIPQDPAFATLRADPRFVQIQKRLGASPS